MDPQTIAQRAAELARQTDALAEQTRSLAAEAARLAQTQAADSSADALTLGLTVFVLAVFVGYYVVWRVTPALHSPLMAVTNAISSVIVVGALLAAGASLSGFSSFMGFVAVVLASVNIFGGFLVTQRMLSKFRKRDAK
jgi:H+-translocating NAD(P) transhydrogenase subunit alpha